MDATLYGMTVCRIQWEAIDAMRAMNQPDPKPAEIVRLDQYRRERWLIKHTRPMNPPPEAA